MVYNSKVLSEVIFKIFLTSARICLRYNFNCFYQKSLQRIVKRLLEKVVFGTNPFLKPGIHLRSVLVCTHMYMNKLLIIF